MRPFENFDWENFWDDTDYALEEYVGTKSTDEEVENIEKELGYKLPKSYIELIKNHNGGIPKRGLFYVDDVEVYIGGIFGIDKNKSYSICGKYRTDFWLSEWGYPNIGIVVADTISGGHDMIFLDYRECGKQGEPKVALVDEELDYEISILADTFEEFIKGLRFKPDKMNEDAF